MSRIRSMGVAGRFNHVEFAAWGSALHVDVYGDVGRD